MIRRFGRAMRRGFHRVARTLAPYRKAVRAGFWATVAALGSGLLDGQLTQTETAAAVGVGLVAAAGVYVAPKNAPVP